MSVRQTHSQERFRHQDLAIARNDRLQGNADSPIVERFDNRRRHIADTQRIVLNGRQRLLDDSYNVGIWFYELAAFPAEWAAVFGAFDEIWVASAFCRDAIGAISPVPVTVVPMPVLPAAPSALSRRDLGLPDGTGTDLMRELRETHGLRGIALSGYGMEEDIARAREAGFVSHLTKPVDFQQLERALREIS